MFYSLKEEEINRLKSTSLGEEIRGEFPVFSRHVDPPLAFLDTTSSAQKPQIVLDVMSEYMASEYANIHRGAYRLSERSTERYENARIIASQFINSSDSNSIIFTKGTTEAMNAIARSIENWFAPNDCILTTIQEHHSNIVPWEMLAKRRSCQFGFVDCLDSGVLNLDDLEAKLKEFSPKILAVTGVSNATGAVNDLKTIINLAHNKGAKVVLDAAQLAPHQQIDVQDLNVDFLAFSGHKIYGPTGIGVLYINPDIIDQIEPYQFGGNMIETVTTEGSTWAKPPHKFEAGTPPIAEAIGLGAALEFVKVIGLERIHKYEHQLFSYAYELLSEIPEVTVIGPASFGLEQAAIMSFVLAGVHPHDVATISDEFHVQVRSGHHCAIPLLKRLGVSVTTRASIGLYSTKEDFNALKQALLKATKIFS